MVELTHIVKYSLRIVWMSLSARRRVSRAHQLVCVLRTKDGACFFNFYLVMKVIYMFSRVASYGKYSFRIQNPYVFIDCSLENGIAVVYWRGGE